MGVHLPGIASAMGSPKNLLQTHPAALGCVNEVVRDCWHAVDPLHSRHFRTPGPIPDVTSRPCDLAHVAHDPAHDDTGNDDAMLAWVSWEVMSVACNRSLECGRNVRTHHECMWSIVGDRNTHTGSIVGDHIGTVPHFGIYEYSTVRPCTAQAAKSLSWARHFIRGRAWCHTYRMVCPLPRTEGV